MGAGSTPSTPLLVVLLLLAVLAGCLGSETDNGDEMPAAFVDPMAYEEGHDHADYAQHANLTWNMKELGWSPLSDAPVAWGELDAHPDHNIALVAFAWPTAGFATVDISDPNDPRLLQVHDVGHGYGADVKWDPSGEWAVLAVQARSQLDPSLPPPLVDPLAATIHSGIELFHITETGVIHAIDAWTPSPDRGVHMLTTHRINERDYVFTAYNGKGVGVFELIIDDPPIGARLVPVNAVLMDDPGRLPSSPTTLGLSGAHDMTVIDDSLLGIPLLYVAHGYDGLFIYDISDPHDPHWPDTPLGTWKDDETDWYMHTVQAAVTDNDTRRIVLVPEVFSDAEAHVVAPLWLLDGTDLADIRLETTWRNPGDHGSELLRFSVHNFQLIDPYIALAHYHGGVWLLEIQETPDATLIEPVAYHVPANDPGRSMSGIYHGTYNMMDAPSVWDVVVHRGVLMATDVNSGLYALEGPAWQSGDDVRSIG